MAYVSQELKKELAPAIKAVAKKYGMKITIAVRHHSTLVVNVKRGPIDFADYTHGKGYIQVNTYYIDRNYSGDAETFLTELHEAMNVGNFDKSDTQTDYFNVGWYTDINVGAFNKPYECTAPVAKAPAAAKPHYRWDGTAPVLVA